VEGERYRSEGLSTRGREQMIKAYETEGHGRYWQVFRWALGQEQDIHLGDMETVNAVLEYARVQEAPVTLYSLEWYEKLQREGEGNE
jgi:hypothetical protein